MDYHMCDVQQQTNLFFLNKEIIRNVRTFQVNQSYTWIKPTNMYEKTNKALTVDWPIWIASATKIKTIWPGIDIKIKILAVLA